MFEKEVGKDKIVLRMSDSDLHYLAGERNRRQSRLMVPRRFKDLEERGGWMDLQVLLT
ncbi:MAG: hypothetical protein ACLU4J_18975 [Butyricimonas paravirosa]